jgi:hypothetical protein
MANSMQHKIRSAGHNAMQLFEARFIEILHGGSVAKNAAAAPDAQKLRGSL